MYNLAPQWVPRVFHVTLHKTHGKVHRSTFCERMMLGVVLPLHPLMIRQLPPRPPRSSFSPLSGCRPYTYRTCSRRPLATSAPPVSCVTLICPGNGSYLFSAGHVIDFPLNPGPHTPARPRIRWDNVERYLMAMFCLNLALWYVSPFPVFPR